MSHFVILVPADNEDNLLEKMLPYKEYGCGADFSDEMRERGYVEFKVEHRKEDFEQDARAILARVANDPDPDLKAKYQKHIDNEEWTSVFCSWSGGGYGPDGNWGYWSGKNEKWDWYSVGGRWSNLLPLKSMVHAGDGEPGLLTEQNDNPPTADFARAGDVDWEAWARSDLEKELETYDEINASLSGFDDWPLEDFSDSKVAEWKKQYNADDGKRAELRKDAFPTFLGFVKWQAMEAELGHRRFWFKWQDIKEYHLPRDEFIQLKSKRAQTYGFITMEGEWCQRGEMGWWGMDDPEKGTPDYDNSWWNFVRSLPDEQRVYVVDCHI